MASNNINMERKKQKRNESSSIGKAVDGRVKNSKTTQPAILAGYIVHECRYFKLSRLYMFA